MVLNDIRALPEELKKNGGHREGRGSCSSASLDVLILLLTCKLGAYVFRLRKDSQIHNVANLDKTQKMLGVQRFPLFPPKQKAYPMKIS